MSTKRKKKATALSRQSADPLWKVLDAKIGGRQGLLEAALASTHPKAPILAELCLDAAFKRSGTKDLAKKAGMGADDLVDLYRNKKWLEATLALHDKLPEVMAGAAEDAAPSEVPCDECHGSGADPKGPGGAACWVCGGKGRIRKPGDKDKLQFVGEAVGMTGKKGPLIQNNIQNVVQGGAGVSFEEMMRRATVKVERKEVEGKVIDIDPETKPGG